MSLFKHEASFLNWVIEGYITANLSYKVLGNINTSLQSSRTTPTCATDKDYMWSC